MRIIMAGCGALGSRIAMEIANPEWDFVLIDDDVVGEENIGTSAYGMEHIGMKKAGALAEMMYHKNKIRAYSIVETISRSIVTHIARHMKSLESRSRYLIIDTFDNPQARNFTSSKVGYATNTLHVGISESREGAIMWDNIYPEQSIDFERGLNPVCTNHLGQQIIQFTASVAAGVVLRDDREGNYIVNEKMEVIRI